MNRIRRLLGFAVGGLILCAPVCAQSNPLETLPPVEDLPTVGDLRARSYPGGQVTIEQDLDVEGGVHRYVVSYPGDGLTLRAIMTRPEKTLPEKGFPVVILAHGGVEPEAYDAFKILRPVEKFFAEQGFLVFKPDYRGHGRSEGEPAPKWKLTPYAAVYAIDLLNLIRSVKRFPDADPDNVFYFGHSIGGKIGIWIAEVTSDLRAAVISAGAPPTVEEYKRRFPERSRFGSNLFKEIKTLRDNVRFIQTPLQLHHGAEDETVPAAFSQSFADAMKKEGKEAELFIYEGAPHNLDPVRSQMLKRAADFFKSHVSAAGG